MRIGKYDVQLLEYGTFAIDGGAFFGIVPYKLWSRSYPHLLQDNRVKLAAYGMLIQGEGHTIVVDAGIGDKHDAKKAAIYGLDQQYDAVRAELAQYKVDPNDVTHFIYTHLHFDHAGGATRLVDGIVMPTFPNARHILQQSQLNWARDPSDKDRASFFPENWEPVVNAGLVDIIDGSTELFPGLRLEVRDGHTPGMQMVVIKGGKGSYGALAFVVDLVPTVAHLPPHYIAAFDNYPLQVLDEKKAFLAQATSQNWIVFLGHDAVNPLCTVEPTSRGYGVKEVIDPQSLADTNVISNPKPE